MTMSPFPVLVGLDGSAAAMHAVEVAAAEARLSRRPLCVLHVSRAPASGETAALVARAVDHARAIAAGVRVSGNVVTGHPVLRLRAATAEAYLLVLGEPVRRAVPAVSLPARVVDGAECPVLVVRGRPRPAGPVVAGVDGTPAGQAALREAAARADRRRVGLIAVHTWWERDTTVLGETSPMSYENWSCQVEHERVLAEALAGFAASRPGLHIQREVLRGSARRRLTERSRGAQLVVVGHRRHRGLDTAMISSVGRHLVEHAACPILVVPTESR